MKKNNNWYMEALESTITEQQFEVDELKAEIEYMEQREDKSELHFKMLNEVKERLAEAVEDLRSAMAYVESQRQYA